MAQPLNPRLPQEYWSSYIVEKLYKSNPHLKLAMDESQYVNGGAIVYIPQAGARPAVAKNRNTFPAVAVQRGDTSVFYPLDTWSTDPAVITWDDENQLSYAKQDSVLGDHTSTLAEVMGDEILYSWVRGFIPQAGGGSTVNFLPANRIIATTGAAAPVNGVDGQTGTRKAFTFKEVQTIQLMFNKDAVAKEDRYCILESYMYGQLLDSLTTNQMHAFEQTADLKNGVLGKLYGFSILDRPTALSLTTAGVFNVPGQSLTATDNIASVFWQKNSVSVAIGETKIFQDVENPLYYGGVYSGLVKAGGRCRRADWRGIAAVAQSV